MSFSVPQKTYVLWFFRTTVVIALICAIFVKICPLPSNFILPTTFIMVIGSAVLFLYIFKYLKSFKITLVKQGFVLKKGVILKTTIIVPKIQYAFINCFATPVMKAFGLSLIVVKIARGSIFMPELETFIAKRILKMIESNNYDF